MKMVWTQDDIRRAIIDTVNINQVRECYNPSLVYLGTARWASTTPQSRLHGIAVWPWGAYLGEGALDAGDSRLCLSFTRTIERL